MRKIELLFDAIRSPADIANIIQLGIALDAKLYLTGNSISYKNSKISGKLSSWGIQVEPDLIYRDSYFDVVQMLKDCGKTLIGTSPHSSKNYYDLDLSKIDPVFVFGTETSGLSAQKQECLDTIVAMPMSNNLKFMTLSVVVPGLVYDLHRQIYQERAREISKAIRDNNSLDVNFLRNEIVGNLGNNRNISR